MAEDKRPTLSDIVNYKPEQYLSEEEVSIIRNTFKDNPRLMKVLRKVLIPSVSDPELPIEEVASDAFLAGRAWAQIPMEEVKTLIVARQDAIQFILGGLIKLKVIAHSEKENDIEATFRRSKDSTK